MANTEQYLQALEAADRRHIEDIRVTRRKIWAESSIDDLDRVVLGLTGSAEMLERYQLLAAAVGKNVGQPIIRVVSGNGDWEHVRTALGGIISGDMYVASSSFNADAKPLESVGGYATLTVPVEPIVAYHNFGIQQVFRGHETSEEAVVVAHLINSQWGNETNNPEKDYWDDVNQANVFIGRRAIYESLAFSHGLSATLLAIEEVAAAEQPLAT